eukprot:m.650443 g.650443  ORF g.650443 m.650443 type:complete len:127 (+) comp22672_c0_seq3:479-859(+)
MQNSTVFSKCKGAAYRIVCLYSWYVSSCGAREIHTFLCLFPNFLSQFNSGCGWPAFDKCYVDAVKTSIDMSAGMKRVEILCSACDGHLGHVFENEGMTETNERHCVNSVSVQYMKAPMEQDENRVL